MMIIYNHLLTDELIQNKVTKNRIKFYVYPATGNMQGAYIVIDPIMTPTNGAFADNEAVSVVYIYQVDVWAKTRLEKDALTKRVKELLKEIRYTATGGGVDEYDAPTNIYRTAIRYRAEIEKT